MKKEDLKKMLKPLVKECIQESIHEALFDSGILTKVVAEVIKGVNIPRLVESMQPKAVPQPVDMRGALPAPRITEVVNGGASQKSTNLEAEIQNRRSEHATEMNATRSRLEESLNGTLGINVFEGVTPAPMETSGQSVLSGVDPNDAGVNLGSIRGLSTLNFKNHIKE